MVENEHPSLTGYLERLEEAFGNASGNPKEVVEEVRADLHAHVDRLCSEGLDEDEAVRRALDDVGNPFELAHHIRGARAPFGGPLVTRLRYAAALGVLLWGAFMLWMFRGWTYGFDPAMVGFITLLHLPVVLVLWPRLVWRRNWMFTPLLGLAAIIGLMFFVSLGTPSSSSGEVALRLDTAGGAVVDPVPPLPPVEEPGGPDRTALQLLSAGAVAIALVLLASLQQRSQRRWVVLVLVAVAGGVEAAYQVEEWQFREDRAVIRQFLEAGRRETGEYPEWTGSPPAELALHNDGTRLRVRKDEFTCFWNRPLSPGHALLFNSRDEGVAVQD